MFKSFSGDPKEHPRLRLHTHSFLLRKRDELVHQSHKVLKRLAPNRNFLYDVVRIQSLEIGDATERYGHNCHSL